MGTNQRPNILIFMTDQEQAQVILPNHPCNKQNLDRIAERGVRFTSAYPPMAHCAPARASFMTGLYPSQHGIYNNIANDQAIRTSLHPGVETWSEKLKEVNYQMFYAGKWGVSLTESPQDRGWEQLDHAVVSPDNEISAGDPRKAGDRGRKNCRKAYENMKPDMTTREDKKRGEIVRPGWPSYTLYGTLDKTVEQTGDYKLVSNAVTKLNELKDDADPWCMYIGLGGPHDPFIVPEPYASMYDPSEIQLPSNYGDAMQDKPAIYRRMKKIFSQLSEQEVREAIAHYWGYCTMVDDLFGKVLDALEHNHQLDNTWIIYLSDHGEHLGAHGLFCKGISQFDEGYRIPLVISHPSLVSDPGRSIDEFVTLMDVAETIIDISDSDRLGKVAGSSLVPFLTGNNPGDWRESIYTQCNGTELYYTSRAVRSKRYKFVYGPVDRDELYDLAVDPSEINNIADDPAMEPVIRQMYQRMWRHAFESEDINFVSYITVVTGDYGPGIVHME